ncbi:MAG: septal ring lytic transglycosylase RlpA family protein [Xenococcaceae cyanobacterium MO_207.B15]|nr:septal ring lytic transglycosylase RlpA family protein [Xenococcaceae cyanobacterium MO_207.B15]
MMKKNQFSVTTVLLSFSASLGFLTLEQLPGKAHTIQALQNQSKSSVINQDNSQTIPSESLTIEQEFSQINELELDNSNSVSLSASEINFPISSSNQIAHHINRVVSGAVYQGKASWYGPNFHGRRTANGEIFNSNALTAAHRSLPFGTKVRVTNIKNGRSVIVRINDRGPFIPGRIIDVSAGAARVLNMVHSGVVPVRVEILGR